MTEIELIQMVTIADEIIDSQFEFWMATSFAVVVAAHTAGASLSKYVRGSIAFLYIVACVVFYLRYQAAVEIVQAGFIELGALNSMFVPSGDFGGIAIGRKILFFGGSLLALALVANPAIGNFGNRASNDT